MPQLFKAALVCFVLLNTCNVWGSAWAQQREALSPDRPDQTNSPLVVAPGVYQLETGWAYNFENSSADGELSSLGQHAFPQTMLRIGLFEHLELRLEYAGYNWLFENIRSEGHPDQNSFEQESGDPGLGLKYTLMRGHAWWWPDLGIEARTNIVMGPASQIIQTLDPSIKLLLEHNFTDKLSLGYNLGFGSESELNDQGLLSKNSQGQALRNYSFLYTASVSLTLFDNLDSFVEVYGEVPLNGGEGDHALDAGVFYMLTPDLKLDAAFGMSVARLGNGFVGLGASYRFN